MVLMYILAGSLILAFFLLYALIWKRVNRHWVRYNGEPVEARIEKVTAKSRGDYGLTYVLHAHWQAPDGKIFAYSNSIWLQKDPTPYLQEHGIDTVLVRIDPKLPATHWIELDFLPEEYLLRTGNFSI